LTPTPIFKEEDMTPRSISAYLPVLFNLLTGSAGAQTVISEVYYDAVGTDAGVVFVELFGTPGTALDDMTLEGINGSTGTVYKTIPLSGLVPADGVFVIGDDSGDGATAVAGADLVASTDLQNGPDSIVLRDSGGILDALGYGDFSSAIFAGEGEAAPLAPAGSSLARLNPAMDTDNNLADFTILGTPTPGEVSVSAVPVPAALWLFMSGLALLTGRLHIAPERPRRPQSRCANRVPA
jgi:hypothetical protein